MAAYKQTGSIWKAAKSLGLAGQTVHERLRRLGHLMAHQMWSESEIAEVRGLAERGVSLSEIAARVGRTYSAVAIKLSRTGTRARHDSWRQKPRRAPLSRKRVAWLARGLEAGQVSVRRLARMEGVTTTTLVAAIQTHESASWRQYVDRVSVLASRACPGCGMKFKPLTKRQSFCTVRCRESHRRDLAYFGGRRKEAVGLQEGRCQLCYRKYDKWLAAHHVFGKENDPNNSALIALCRGCHDIVTRLAARPWVETPDTVADLVSLALARRGKRTAVVTVDIEHWDEQELADYLAPV